MLAFRLSSVSQADIMTRSTYQMTGRIRFQLSASGLVSCVLSGALHLSVLADELARYPDEEQGGEAVENAPGAHAGLAGLPLSLDCFRAKYVQEANKNKKSSKKIVKGFFSFYVRLHSVRLNSSV